MPPVVIAWAAVAIAVAGAVYAATRDFSAPEPDDVGSKVQKRGSKAPRNVIYGETIVSSVNVYNNVYNRDTQYLTTVHTIGVGPITKILQVYIDESKVFYNDLTDAANVSRSVLLDEAVDERGDLVVDGRDARNSTYGYKPAHYRTNMMRSDFSEQITSIQLRVGNYDERHCDQVERKSDGEWTSEHRGDRVAHIGMVIKRDTGANARIMTARFNLTAKVQGMALYDPRYHLDPSEKAYEHGIEVPEEHRQCGRNPALALLDYLIDDYYGAKIPIEYIDVPSFSAVANWCDDNGLYIDAEIDSGRSFGENIQDILTCFQGVLVIENGVLVCKYEDIVVAPAFSFDESNIIALGNVIQKGTASYWNVVEVDYKNRAMDEKGDVFTLPANVNTDARILRDGFIRTTKVNLPYTLDGTSFEGVGDTTVDGPVKFIANRIYALSDFQGSVEIDVDLEEYPVKIMDVVELTSLPLGWNKKLWRVRSMRKSLRDDSYNIATLTLKEYDDSMYQSQLDGVASRLRANRDPFSQVLPTNLQFNLTSFIKEGSGVLSWEFANSETSVSFDVEYRLTNGNGQWVRLGRTNEQQWQVQRLKADYYDFRVRAYHIVAGNSSWVQLDGVIMIPGVQLPTVTGLSVDDSTGDFHFTWDDMLETEVTDTYDPNDPDASGSATKRVKDWFKYYLVKVYDGTDLIYTTRTTDPYWTYTYALNKSNGLSRTVKIEVQIEATEGSVSAPVDVFANNVQVTEYPGPTVIAAGGALYIDWDAPSDPDYVGTEVHISNTAPFTPSLSTLVAKVVNGTFYTHSLNGSLEDKYIMLGNYDVFGQDNITYSPATLGAATSSVGPAGSSVRFKFKYSLTAPTLANVNDPNPSGWVDDIENATRVGNEVLYMIMAYFSEAGAMEGSWSTPVKQESHLSMVQYAPADSGPWESTYDEATDLYYRTSNDGGVTWGDAIRFKGSDGADATFVDMRFIESATAPSTPTGDEPVGWTDGPPDSPTDHIWMVKGTKEYSGALIGSWSTPVRLTGEDGQAGSSVEVQYSIDGATNWHTTYVDGDIYMRTRIGTGAWSNPQRFVGSDGQRTYYHVAYADSADGSLNFNQLDGVYIGTYVDTTPTDSSTYSDYTWRQFRGSQGVQGTQGIPGVNGATGETTYLHVAYADDILGNGFSQSPVGKLYVGMYTDFQITDSTDPAQYTWSLLKGASGNYVDMRFQQSASEPAVTQVSEPNGWSDAPPPNPTNAVWMIKSTKDATGALVTNWSTPIRITGTNGGADGASVEVEYSVNGSTNWHTTYAAGDIYMRQRVGTGAWSDPIKFVGEDGTAGLSAPYVDIIFKESASLPSTPTGNDPTGWLDAPPASPTDPIWMSKATKSYDGTLIGSWSTPVRLTGEDGQSGDSVEVQYSVNGSTNWHTTYAAGDIYMRTRIGTGAWSVAQKFIGEDGVSAPPLLVQYSVNGSTNWHTTFAVGDIYMRQSVDNGSSWTNSIRIVGEEGAPGTDGTYLDYRFSRSASQPSTPTGNTPSGWPDAPPDGANPLWMISGRKTAAGALIGVWTTPVRITGDQGDKGDKGDTGATGAPGTNGENGAPGDRGAGRYEVSTSTGSWSNSTANAACPGGPVEGDVVTIFKSSDPGVQNTRQYTSGTWTAFSLHIHGSALIDGTLNASAIQAYTRMVSPRIDFIGSTHMRIQAAQGFGSSNQFIEWFGPLFLTGGVPNMAQVTEANAITYIKSNGDAYFGGSLSAGILRTSVSNTKTSHYTTNEVACTIGPFGTNGGAKQVVVSWGAQGSYNQSGSCSTYNTPAMGIRLERSLNGGSSWTTVGTGTINGWVSTNYEGEQNICYVQQGGGGSLTFTDNSTSTANFTYRVVVTSYVMALSNSLISSQTVSLISTEG